jgi:hypothetical protein
MRLKPVTEETQQAFYAQTFEKYEQAAAACGEIRHAFRIADTAVRLRFAGSALVSQIIPAFEHLRVEDGDSCDFEVCLWDSRSTKIDLGAPPCNRRNFTNRGNIWGFQSERYLSAFHYGEFSVNTMDTEAGRAVYWVRDATTLPFWVNASPLRSILHWRLARDGKQLVHAAAIGTDEGAVVIPGRGGSGKSTTALLALRHGLRYVSDDYCVVGLGPEPRVYSLYSTAKLELDSIERFPELAAHGDVKRSAGYEKGVVFLHPAFESQLAASLPLSAILLPEITGREATSLATVDALTVEHAASFTTISHLPHTGQKTVEFLREASLQVPRAKLELGTRYEAIPDAISECARRGPQFEAVARRGVDVDNVDADYDLPLISVVIPVHNGASFIEDAMASIRAQKYPRLEIIFVDDASSDDSRAVIEALPDDVCYYDFRTNLGPSEARNRGVREAAGDFIAFLDVDYLWPHDSLRRLVRILLENEKLAYVRGRAQVLVREDEMSDYLESGTPEESFPHYIGSALFRRSSFLSVGPFDRTLRFGEDSDWYLRAAELELDRLQIDDVTLYVRRHGANMTEGKTQLELNRVRVLKGVLDRRRDRGEI